MNHSLIKMQTIKELRERMHLTQADLARQAMVSQTTIANWEQKRTIPTLDQFRRVCNALNVRMDRVALTPYDRLLRTYNIWYHLHAHRTGTEWIARVLGVDISAILSKSDPYGTEADLPAPLDETDPETISPVVPVTWKWEATGATPDEAIQRLADRITSAYDRVLDHGRRGPAVYLRNDS